MKPYSIASRFRSRTALQKAQPEHQAGQALAEGLVALLFLLSLWVAVAWLGRLQEMALTVQHASSHAAFAAARFDTRSIPDYTRGQFFSGPAHQWSDRGGNSILGSVADQVEVRLARSAMMPTGAQPGGEGADASSLREDLRLNDLGILKAQVIAAPRAVREVHAGATEQSSVLGLSQFDTAYPVLRRHTSLLTDAGHASSDSSVQLTLQGSETAWSHSANVSYALGKKIHSVMRPVDSGWARPAPVFDWLGPWAGRVPERRLLNVPGDPYAR